jgi:hypothetical protein
MIGYSPDIALSPLHSQQEYGPTQPCLEQDGHAGSEGMNILTCPPVNACSGVSNISRFRFSTFSFFRELKTL